MKRLFLLAAIVGIPLTAMGGHCPKVRRVVAVQAYVQPQHYFQAGQALQEDALAERIAARVLAKLEASASTTAQPQQQAVGSLIVANCAKCHSGADAKGGIDLSGELTCEVRLHAIWQVMHNDPARRMPKGKDLDPETLGLLIQELAAVTE